MLANFEGGKKASVSTFCRFPESLRHSEPRSALAELRIGVDGNLIRAIRSLYVGHKARLRLNGELSEFFPIDLGVKQGCVLSPELFKEFINDLIEAVNTVGSGVKLDFMSVSCLLFADDLVLMSESLDGLKSQATALES